MGSTRKGMLNVLIAAVLWGSSGVCAQYIMEQSQMSSQFLTMTRLILSILLTLSFVHGDKIFSIINNHKDAISLLIFSVVGALTVQLTFLLTIEKSNAATATVLQFLSPTIIVAWFSLVRKSRPGILVFCAILTSLVGTFLLVTHGNPSLSIPCRVVLGHCLGICCCILYHLSLNANCPLWHVVCRRLEYADRRSDSVAFFMLYRDKLCC